MNSNGWGSLIYGTPNKDAGKIVTGAFVRRVLEYAQPYRQTIGAVLVVTVVKAVVQLVPPLLFRAMIDEAIEKKDKGVLTELAVQLVVVSVVVALLGVVKSYYICKVGEYVISDLRVATYAWLQKCSIRFFSSSKTGELMSRLSNDTRGARDALSNTFIDVVTNGVNCTLVIGVLLYIDWELTVIGLSVLPLFIVPGNYVAGVLRTLVRRQMDVYAKASTVANQTLNISGVLLTKVFGRADGNTAAYADAVEKVRDESVAIKVVSVWFSFGMGLLSTYGLVVVYWYGGRKVIDGHLSVGTLVTITAYLSSLYGPLIELVNSRVNIASSLVSFERVFEVLDLEHEVADADNAIDLDEIAGTVEVDAVSFSYEAANWRECSDDDDESGRDQPRRRGGDEEDGWGDDDVRARLLSNEAAGSGERKMRRRRRRRRRLGEVKAADRLWPRNMGMSGRMAEHGGGERGGDGGGEEEVYALTDVSFRIGAGQMAAVVGRSGAGKSSLLSLLSRLYDPTEGAVRIDGYDLRELRLATVARHVATVTQESFLFNDTLRGNLAFAKADASDAEMMEALRIANMADVVQALPDGLDTHVGERGYRLSGGEKQRIAIARVVLRAPKILILDEATSSLDSVSEKAVQAALDGLLGGADRTSIVVAHRLSTILSADVIIVLDNGRVVEQGTHTELLARAGAYAELFHTQFGVGDPAAP